MLDSNKLQVVLDAKALLGEGPSWDAANQRLLWVDIENERLHVYYPETDTDQVYEIGKKSRCSCSLSTKCRSGWTDGWDLFFSIIDVGLNQACRP